MEGAKRLLTALPPGAGLQIALDDTGRSQSFSLPLWLYWSEISRAQSEIARQHAPSDEMVDAISATIAGEERERPDESNREARQETLAALVAVSAASFALDAFYGSVKPLVDPPGSGAARERQIFECLKLGFQIGPYASRFLDDLDWLFETRRNAVHHSEQWEPAVPVRETEETIVIGGPETFNFSADSAERACGIAREVIQTCLENPKSATAEWAEKRRDAQEKMANARPNARD